MSDTDDEARDAAQPDETIVEPEGLATDESEDDFHPFDEIDEDFRPTPAVHVLGADGLPLTVDQTTASDIPALSVKSLICMGDFSKFVLRDEWGHVCAEFVRSEVTRMPNGKWTVSGGVARRVDGVKAIIGVPAEGEPVEVEPIRPQCRHYVRQKTSFALNAQHSQFSRLCSARRTTEGAFMTVRDVAVGACDMREPFDAESSKVLDEFDALKIEQGTSRELLPIFQGMGIFERKFDAATKKQDQQDPKEH
jgi:hypothetical protein